MALQKKQQEQESLIKQQSEKLSQEQTKEEQELANAK